MNTARHERRGLVPRVIIEHDVAATMRDGTVLRADIVRPDITEPCPVLLCRTPYGKHDATANPFLDAVDAARHRYIVALQDVRGRGCSDGDWQPFVNEFDDGADSVAWAADLPGSDGNVGMFGSSYLGFTQWAAATRQPAALRALVPALTWSDTRNGLLQRGGTPETGLTSYLRHYGFAHQFPDPDAVDSLATPALRSPDTVSFTDTNRPPSLLDPGRLPRSRHHRASPEHRRLVRRLPRRHPRAPPTSTRRRDISAWTSVTSHRRALVAHQLHQHERYPQLR